MEVTRLILIESGKFLELMVLNCFEYILNHFIKLKNLIFKKRRLLFFIKLFFLILTIYHCIVMTVDYLGFEYRYNLIVEDNSKGFHWKPMSVCTESKVLFDKHKVNQYFDLSEIYTNYENLINNDPNYKWISGFSRNLENEKMYRMARFFVPFVDRIFDETNFVELSSLTVNEKELFECSAKLHFENQSIDSFAMEIENCFDNFVINTTVIANNTFGICFEIFETNSSIVLKRRGFH